MKKILVLSTFVFMTACSFQANDAVSKSLTNINEELVVIQRSITDTKMSIDDVKAGQELINTDITTNSNAIAELRSEIAYLNNELMLLKSRSGSQMPEASDTLEIMSDNASMNNIVIDDTQDDASSQQIIIIEDSSAAKNSIYSYALELNRQKKYADAREKFMEFLTKYPNDPLAGNAQYWIGETYYSVSDNNNALMAFNDVMVKYPKSSKVPDAMLKVGYTQEKLNDRNTAAATLKNLIAKYPKSRPATLAKQKLQSWGM